MKFLKIFNFLFFSCYSRHVLFPQKPQKLNFGCGNSNKKYGIISINSKLNSHENRFNEIDKRFNDIDNRFNEIGNKLGSMEANFNEKINKLIEMIQGASKIKESK